MSPGNVSVLPLAIASTRVSSAPLDVDDRSLLRGGGWEEWRHTEHGACSDLTSTVMPFCIVGSAFGIPARILADGRTEACRRSVRPTGSPRPR